MALGPALGSWLAVEFGYDAMFLASSALGLAAYIMTLRLPETLPAARGVEWQDLNVLQEALWKEQHGLRRCFCCPWPLPLGRF